MSILILTGVGLYLNKYEFTLKEDNIETNKIIEVNTDKLINKIEDKQSFFVYVYSNSCDFCKEFYPTFVNYLEKSSTISFQINADTNQSFVEKILSDNYQGTPAVYFFKDGLLDDYFIGVQSEKTIDKYVTEFKKGNIDSYLESITIKDFNRIKEKNENELVYIGRPDCNDCISFEPMFIDVIKEDELDKKIKYLNIQSYREDFPEQWEQFKKENYFEQTPVLLDIKDGQIISVLQWDVEKGISKQKVREWLISR